IYLLGGFRVVRDGVPVPEAEWRRRKSKVLLKILALAQQHRLSRDQVLEWLWPDLPPEAGTNNLHKILHLTRRVLEPDLKPGAPSPYLRFEDNQVSLGPAWVDVEEFEAAAARAEATGDSSDLEAALTLSPRDLLPEDLYEEWATPPRERIQRRVVGLWLLQANRYLARGDLAAATDAFGRVLHIDAVHEEAHRGLMVTYARQGKRHQAIRQYQRCRELLAEELGVEPSPETQETYQRILAGRIGPAPTVERAPAGPPLVGRDAELDLLEEHLDGAAARGRGVFLGGEAGVGKTRLCEAFLEFAAQRGLHTMRGACHEKEGQMPYLPFVEALRGYLAAQSEEIRRALTEPRPELGLLLPEAPPTGRPAPVPSTPPASADVAHEHKRRLFESVFTLLRDVSATAPCVLLIEDVHAADEPTLQLLHYLMRRASEIPLLILATCRDDEVSAEHPLSGVMAELLLARSASRMALRPLAPGDLAALASGALGGRPVDRDLVQAVYEMTEGNPLYTQEVLRTMQQEGAIAVAEDRWRLRHGARPAPSRDLTSLLAHRQARLGEGARAVLSAASVAGRAFSFKLLAAMTAEPELKLLDALDAAIAAGILEETEAGYRFRHALLREGFYNLTSRHRRAYLHRLAASALEAQGDQPAEVLAHHWYHSDRPEAAVGSLIAAGDRARGVFAIDQAIEHFGRAIDVLLSSPGPDRGRLAELYQRLGSLHQILADAPASLEAYDRALTHADDPVTRARIRRSAAAVCITAGDSDRGFAYLSAALEDLAERPDAAESSRVHYHLSQIAWHRERFDEAFALAQQALTLAEDAGIPTLIAQGYEMLALSCHSLGEWQQGLAYVEKRSALVGGALDVAGAFDVHL
ncbi:MAG: ATP-binding protein, partial [bacterium]